VPSRRLTAAALLAALSLGACTGGRPGLEAAQAACHAYADTERGQAATTPDGTESVRATAKDHAAHAAAEDEAWAGLQSDIEGAYAHLAASADAHDAGDHDGAGREIRAYQAADEAVQADCADADAEIGPLRP
jgi:hypothetical protein